MKYLIIIFLLFSVNGKAQIIRAQPFYRPITTQFLLDAYPNAAAAYSLRKLNSSYSGNAIKVRRSSDNITQDIGFTSNGDLDTTSMKTFVGANNGFIDTWYDQSGNGRNATQATLANQPRIMLSGVIDRSGGRVSFVFDNSNDRLISTFTINQPFHTFVASNSPTINNAGTSYRTIIGGRNSASTDAGLEIDVNTTLTQKTLLYSGIILGDNTIRSGNSIISALSNSTNSNLFYNGSSIATGNAGTLNIGALHLGSNWDLTRFFNNRYYEIIIYSSNQSSNRTGIESNINSYYSIY